MKKTIPILTIIFLLTIAFVSASSFLTTVELKISGITGISELDNSDGTSLLITITNSTGIVVSRNAEEGIYNAGDIIAITGEKFSLDYANDYTYNLSTDYGNFIYSFSTPNEPSTGASIEYRNCYNNVSCDETNACQKRIDYDDIWLDINSNWVNGREGENCGEPGWICENGICRGTLGASCLIDGDCLSGYVCNVSGECESARKRVFVTSTTYNGNLGGLSGADAKCQTQADAAGLGGTWTAFLSSSTVSINNRIADHAYYLIDEVTKVVDNLADLLDDSLDHAINKTEYGVAPLSYPTYTYTGCTDWTSAIHCSCCAPQGNNGASNLVWDSHYCGSCDDYAKLYCFEN